MDNIKPTFYIDSSGLKLLTCWRHFYLRVIKGKTGKGLHSYKMAYGSAGHKFTEAYYKGEPLTACFEHAIRYYAPFNDQIQDSPYEFRTTPHLLKVLKQYAITFPRNTSRDINGKPIYTPTDFVPLIDKFGDKAVEFKFARPLYSCEKFNLVLCGTTDLACSYVGHNLLLVDYKFTGIAYGKADEFLNGYHFDAQPLLYSLVFKEELNLDYYPPVMIRGIFCKKPTIKSEKEGVFDGVNFKDSPIFSYSNSRMEKFKSWLKIQIDYIVNNLTSLNDEQLYDIYNMTACKSIFGHCPYFDVCSLDPEHQQGKLDYSYIIDPYEPLKFRD